MLSIIRLRLMRLKDDYIIILLMTIMALAFTYIMGAANNVNYIPKVIIVDHDQSKYSQMIIEELEDNPTFKCETTLYEDAIEQVDKGKVLSAIVINKGFNADINQGNVPTIGLVKIKDDRDIFTLENIVAGITSKMIGNIKIAQVTSGYVSENSSTSKESIFNEAYERAKENWKYRKPIEVSKETIQVNKQNEYDNTKHGLIGFSLFFSMYTIVFAIGEILNERKYNTWQRLIISPINRTALLGGNFVISYVIGLIQISVLIFGGRYLFGVDFGSNMLAIFVLIATFVFAVTAMGLFLSGIVKTHAQLSAITPVVLTSMGMLGGAMWPLEIVKSKVVLALANITPTKWAIQGIEKIAMYGAGFEAAILPAIILTVMGIIFFGLGVKLVKFE